MSRPTSELAAEWLIEVAGLLVEKGRLYGDSVGNPVRIFSSAGKSEGLRIRLDDKISRMIKGSPGNEDTLKDIAGYIALLAVVEDETPKR